LAGLDGRDLHVGAAGLLEFGLAFVGAGLVVGDGGCARAAVGVGSGEGVVLHVGIMPGSTDIRRLPAVIYRSG
jgi:hypothetical protein